MRLKKKTNPLLEGTAALKSQDMQDLFNIELTVLGERMRRARQEKKISQRDVANGLFTSAYLSSLELGKTRPTPDTLIELAHRLDKSIEYFLRPASDFLNGGGLPDEDYLRALRARQTLWLAQVGVERARTQALFGDLSGSSPDDTAQSLLDEAEQQSNRLSNRERAYYYYLLGRFMLLDVAATDRAMAALNESLQHLELTRPTTGRQAESSEAVETSVLTQTEMGDLYLKQERIMQALSQYQAGLEGLDPHNGPANEGDSEGEVVPDDKPTLDRLRWRLLARLARCYARLNDREQTLQTLREAVQIVGGQAQSSTSWIKVVSTPGEIDGLLSLTDNYYRQARVLTEKNDFQQASLKIGRSLQLFEQVQDGTELLDLYANLAELELGAGQYEQAESYVRQVLSWLGTNTPAHQPQRLKVLVALAQVRSRQNQPDEAMQIIEEALTLVAANGAVRLYQTAAEVQARLGDREKATSYYQKALDAIANNYDEPVTSNNIEAVADIYYSYGQQLREWGEIEKAFEFLEKAYQYRQKR